MINGISCVTDDRCRSRRSAHRPLTSAVMLAMRCGEMFPHRTFLRSSGFFWSFRLEMRLRRRVLYFISVEWNSWKICGRHEESRTTTHIAVMTASSSASLWVSMATNDQVTSDHDAPRSRGVKGYRPRSVRRDAHSPLRWSGDHLDTVRNPPT